MRFFMPRVRRARGWGLAVGRVLRTAALPTTSGLVVAAYFGAWEMQMFGFTTTVCPRWTKRPMPPMPSTAARVALAGDALFTTLRSGMGLALAAACPCGAPGG